MTMMKKLLEQNVAYGRRRIAQVFRDFCELSALEMRNAVDLVGREARIARFREVAEGYTAEEMQRFAEVLAHLALELGKKMGDALGELYMSLDLGNERLGQFFTPYDLSLLAAQITLDDLVDQLKHQSYITMHEPACGSGGMIIATADALRREGINYQRSMHVSAVDLDITAVHMTFVQLTLLHIPAVIAHGNTLSLEVQDLWPTPAHVLGGWWRKSGGAG